MTLRAVKGAIGNDWFIRDEAGRTVAFLNGTQETTKLEVEGGVRRTVTTSQDAPRVAEHACEMAVAGEALALLRELRELRGYTEGDVADRIDGVLARAQPVEDYVAGIRRIVGEQSRG